MSPTTKSDDNLPVVKHEVFVD